MVIQPGQSVLPRFGRISRGHAFEDGIAAAYSRVCKGSPEVGFYRDGAVRSNTPYVVVSENDLEVAKARKQPGLVVLTRSDEDKKMFSLHSALVRLSGYLSRQVLIESLSAAYDMAHNGGMKVGLYQVGNLLAGYAVTSEDDLESAQADQQPGLVILNRYA